MILLKMGNAHVGVATTDSDDVTTVAFTPAEAEAVTTVELPDEWSVLQSVQSVVLPGGIHDSHFGGPPTWVWCANPLVAHLLADHFGCPVKEQLDEN